MNKQILSSLALVGISFGCGYYLTSRKPISPAPNSSPASEKSQASSCAGTKTSNDLAEDFRAVKDVDPKITRLPASAESFRANVDCSSENEEDEMICLTVLQSMMKTNQPKALPVLRDICNKRKHRFACSAASLSGDRQDAMILAELDLNLCVAADDPPNFYSCFDAAIGFVGSDGDPWKILEAARIGCERGNPMLCSTFTTRAVQLGLSETEMMLTLKKHCVSDGPSAGNYEIFCENFYPYTRQSWQLALDSRSNSATSIDDGVTYYYYTYRELLFGNDGRPAPDSY